MSLPSERRPKDQSFLQTSLTKEQDYYIVLISICASLTAGRLHSHLSTYPSADNAKHSGKCYYKNDTENPEWDVKSAGGEVI